MFKDASRNTCLKENILFFAQVLTFLLITTPLFVFGQEDKWTPWASSGSPPGECPSLYLPIAVQCEGEYCGRVRLLCRQLGLATEYDLPTIRYWTHNVSEETDRNTETCGVGFLTGLSCSGKNCDNISLECTEIIGYEASDCDWLEESMSEENVQGIQQFSGENTFAAGMRCHGQYCDNKQFLLCKFHRPEQ